MAETTQKPSKQSPEVCFEGEDNSKTFILCVNNPHFIRSEYKASDIVGVALVNSAVGPPAINYSQVDQYHMRICFLRPKDIKKTQCKKAGTTYQLQITLKNGQTALSQKFSISKGVERLKVSDVCPHEITAGRPSKIWLFGDFPEKFKPYRISIGEWSNTGEYSVDLLKFVIPPMPDDFQNCFVHIRLLGKDGEELNTSDLLVLPPLPVAPVAPPAPHDTPNTTNNAPPLASSAPREVAFDPKDTNNDDPEHMSSDSVEDREEPTSQESQDDVVGPDDHAQGIILNNVFDEAIGFVIGLNFEENCSMNLSL